MSSRQVTCFVASHCSSFQSLKNSLTTTLGAVGAVTHIKPLLMIGPALSNPVSIRNFNIRSLYPLPHRLGIYSLIESPFLQCQLFSLGITDAVAHKQLNYA